MTTPIAYATAATRHNSTPTTEAPPLVEVDSPTIAAPANDTAIPASSGRGSPSPRIRLLSTAIRIGPMLTSRAAVPASTFRSPAFSATM